MISQLDKDHGEGTLAFCEVCEIHESALSELVDGHITQPNIESFVFFIEGAGEV